MNTIQFLRSNNSYNNKRQKTARYTDLIELMSSDPISIFISYSRKDQAMMQELESHLEPLKLGGLVSSWHDGCISPGEEWEPRIKENLKKAHVIILLISVDFIRSGYCYNVELKQAIERHKAGDACVIPVILRSCIWKQVPVSDMLLGDLQALPKDAKPISKWTDRDDAFTSIAEGILSKIQQLRLEQEKVGKPHYDETKAQQQQLSKNQTLRLEQEKVEEMHHNDMEVERKELNTNETLEVTSKSQRKVLNSPVQNTSGVVIVTDNTFKKQVLESHLPVLVYLWAPWCGPCKMIDPIIAEIAKQYEGQIKVTKVNTDNNPDIFNQLHVRSIPTMVIFKGAQQVDMIVGAVPEDTLSNCIERYL